MRLPHCADDIEKRVELVVRGLVEWRNLQPYLGKRIGDNDGRAPGHGDQPQALPGGRREELQGFDGIDHLLQAIDANGAGLPEYGVPDLTRLR